MVKKALITGITGQDGAYLSKLLLSKNYEVYGLTRDSSKKNLRNLRILNIENLCKIYKCDLSNKLEVNRLINKIKPNEIYSLSGLSSVAKSFVMPHLAYDSIINSTVNILESIRKNKKNIKFYLACSGECYGNIKSTYANEDTVFDPLSPYAVAKTAAFYITKNYREAFNIHASSGILFNHESPLRGENFVTQKIILGVIDIVKGRKKNLELGSLNIKRDWGWAPEYVEAMYLIMQNKKSTDFVIASGKSHSLEKFIEVAFNYFGMDWKKYTKTVKSHKRPLELIKNRGNSKKAEKILKWKPTYNLKKIVHTMIEDQLNTK